MATGKINNIEAYNKSQLWSFDWFMPHLSRGIAPSDIDFIIESSGNFLVIEIKAPGVEIPKGQYLMLSRLSELVNFTVFVLWGEPNIPCSIAWFKNGMLSRKYNINKYCLCNLVKHWQCTKG